jgi:septum formation protein
LDKEQAASQQEQAGIAVILASASPRRKELLERAGVKFSIVVCETDESIDEELYAQPEEAAKKIAEKKAGAVIQQLLACEQVETTVVIGADTMVVFEGTVFGKPRNLSDGTHMLKTLSGNTHEVITAVSVWMVSAGEDEKVNLGFRTFADSARVTFKELDDEQIAEYLRQGESFDKAGAYAAQGKGAELIEKIEGDIDTVIGLPVTKLVTEFPDLVTNAE